MILEIDVRIYYGDEHPIRREFTQGDFNTLNLKSLYDVCAEAGYMIEDAFDEAKGKQ